MRLLALSLVFAAFLPLAAQTQLPPPASHKIDYDTQVKPLLSQNCYSCHGEEAQQSGLRLDLRQNALRGGDYGPVIVPGKSAESRLIRKLVDGDGGMPMPPSGRLSDDEIGILRAWIDQGADFRTDVAAAPRPAAVVDPRLAAAIQTVRSKPLAAVQKALAPQMDLVAAKDGAGSTLLHHAAGFGTLETLTWLLDAGADVNAANRRRSTPLHWAIHDEGKVRALVGRGARVAARQVDGRTALFLASSVADGAPVVQLLLARGADPKHATATGQTPLMAAAARGNVETVQVLLEHGADVNAVNGAGETALILAASEGSTPLVQALLDRGADARARTKRGETALGNAATAGVDETVKLLLDRGAEINVRNLRGFSPLMLAASSDAVPASIVKQLLERGADTRFTGDYDETARDLAVKRGHTDVARLLGAAGPPGVSSAMAPASPSSSARRPLGASVQRAMTLLEKQSHNFIRIAGCDSCHSQDLPSAAAALARRRGLDAPREFPQLPSTMKAPPERLMDLNFVAIAGLVWELFDLGMNDQPPTAYTDAAARAIAAAQTRDGSWSAAESRRPPMNAGDFQATALAVFALQRYAPALAAADTARALDKARAWLVRSSPATTQDRAFHLLGLSWTNAPAASIAAAAKALLAEQRGDGGWAQLPTMPTDAYATGEALYALNVAGNIPTRDPSYRRGVEYLLRTQAADGSWHVPSRAIWLQPYFESGFPYARDQFISAAGTAWASMALTLALEAPPITERSRR